MLKLYNAGASVCSVKVRLGLAEKGFEWEDILLVLPKGEQFDPEYLKLNPNGVVPTLVHDDLVIIESSIILEYVDSLDTSNTLMPSEPAAKIATKIWLLRCLDVHGAINTMTFSTVNRDRILASQTPEQIETTISKMPNPKMADKRRDLLKNGVNSDFVLADFSTLRRLFSDMQTALTKTKFMTGNEYALADVALLAYLDRLDNLGLSGLWKEQAPLIDRWLDAARARPSYGRAMDKYQAAEERDATRKAGAKHWPDVQKRWGKFISR